MKIVLIYDNKKQHQRDMFGFGYFDYSRKDFSANRKEFLLSLINAINQLEDNLLKERCLACFRKYNDELTAML